MPAAAVTPAPIAYINAVAVKKLVVEIWSLLQFGPSRKASTNCSALYLITMYMGA